MPESMPESLPESRTGQRQLAFLSTENLEEFIVYDELTYAHFEALGWSVEAVPWRAGLDPDFDWSRFEMVIIRSPWDYQQEAELFLDALVRIDSGTRLENPLEVVRWNLQKGYLRDLEERGVPIVPTLFRDAGEPIDGSLLGRFEGANKVVVKPLVSGNADHTYVLDVATIEADGARLTEIFASRAHLAQPFVPGILEEGEFSLFYFAGKFSHAILKTPKAGDFRVQEEHGGRIRGIEPDKTMLSAGQKALEAIEQDLLYARVDLVRAVSEGGEHFQVMELELIEPSLYFPYAEGSAERFARATIERVVAPTSG